MLLVIFILCPRAWFENAWLRAAHRNAGELCEFHGPEPCWEQKCRQENANSREARSSGQLRCSHSRCGEEPGGDHTDLAGSTLPGSQCSDPGITWPSGVDVVRCYLGSNASYTSPITPHSSILGSGGRLLMSAIIII